MTAPAVHALAVQLPNGQVVTASIRWRADEAVSAFLLWVQDDDWATWERDGCRVVDVEVRAVAAAVREVA